MERKFKQGWSSIPPISTKRRVCFIDFGVCFSIRTYTDVFLFNGKLRNIAYTIYKMSVIQPFLSLNQSFLYQFQKHCPLLLSLPSIILKKTTTLDSPCHRPYSFTSYLLQLILSNILSDVLKNEKHVAFTFQYIKDINRSKLIFEHFALIQVIYTISKIFIHA